MKTKIEIKNWLTGVVIFSFEKEGNTIKDTVEEAVKSDADLRDADLRGADLYGANLYGAKNIPFIPLSCPSDGAFVGWKIVENTLVKLIIPEDARRSSATTNKCRCDKAKVLEITSLDGTKHLDEIVNDNYSRTIYRVGEMVYPDSFDEDRWSECSNGIHFFINKQDAIDYV